MNRPQPSLSRRLLLGAAGFIAVALVVAAVVIGFVLHRFVQGQIDQRLDTQIVFLTSMLTASADGTIALTGDADGPPFDRPRRGWYWQVEGPNNVLSSRSLDGAAIDTAGEKRPRHKRAKHGPEHGPRGEPLQTRMQEASAGGTPVTILVSAPRGAVFGPLREAMTTLAISLAVLGLALLAAMVLQVRLGLRPLERLRRAVADVRGGRSDRVPADQPREVLPLVDELNGLLEQNAANLERARRHVANLAHGLKTPLATLAIALPERDPDGKLQALVTQMERRIRHHLGRARAAALSGPARVRTLLAPRVGDLGHALGKINADKPVALTMAIPADLALACEPQDVDEMIGNLMENAYRWAAGRVHVAAAAGDDGVAAVAVDDDGPGLRPDQIPQVMRPGARIDEAAPGFGFGLPIARELAELYGGTLTFGASPWGGLRVTLRLPLAAAG